VTSAPINASALGSLSGKDALEHGTPTYRPRNTNRYDGPALPPNGSPEPQVGLERLNERLERLAFGGRPEGHNAPPLETYTTSPTEHGDVVRATEEYVRWFRRTYPASGPEDRVSQPSPRPSSEGDGGAESVPGRWKQNDIAP
jgi:hypothetical protein